MKRERIQRKHHNNLNQKLCAITAYREGKAASVVAKKYKVTAQTIYKWHKNFGTIDNATGDDYTNETYANDNQIPSEVEDYINKCLTNPECIHSIELGPDAYEKVLHLCKLEERSIDGQIRYLIKQAYSMHENTKSIPF